MGPTHWQIGSLVCERTETTPPADALAAWEEHGCMFIIREQAYDGIAFPPSVESSDELKLVHQGGNLSAV